MAEPVSQFDSENQKVSDTPPSQGEAIAIQLQRIVKSNDKTRNAVPGRLQAGEIVGGRFEIIAVVGVGGMGLVYQARQKSTGIEQSSYVALKTLRSPYMTAKALVRFRKEAKAASALNHPGLIKVHEFGMTDDGLPFMVMDFVHGGSLADAIHHCGQLPVDRVVNIFLQAVDALAYAHEKGIIHRDLKPSNILLEEAQEGQEQVRVADFGVAMMLEDDSGEALRLTRTGELLGSPLYMSPEQCAGKRADQRSDIYSLGCSMYEALTGGPPFQGETALATIMKHQYEESLSLAEGSMGKVFSEVLEQVMAKALAKEPSQRYQSMQDLGPDLRSMKVAVALKKAQNQKDGQEKPSLPRALVLPIPLVVLVTVATILFSSVLTVTVSKMLAARHDVDPSDEMAEAASNLFGERGIGSQSLKKTEMKGKRRIFHFSDKFTVGGLYSLGSDSSVNPLGQATGTKMFPAETRLHLRPGWIICEAPKLFLQFLPDDFEGIDCENLPITDHDLKFMEHLTGLYDLNLANTKITDDGMDSIAKLTHIGLLNLSETAVTGKGIAKLSSLNSIDRLGLNGVPVDEVELAYFEKNPRILLLDMRHTNLQNEQLRSIACLQWTKCLGLRENPQITDAGMKYLCKMPRLWALDVQQCNISPAAIAHFQAMPNLRTLYIDIKDWKPEDVARLKTALPRCAILDESGKRKSKFGVADVLGERR